MLHYLGRNMRHKGSSVILGASFSTCSGMTLTRESNAVQITICPQLCWKRLLLCHIGMKMVWANDIFDKFPGKEPNEKMVATNMNLPKNKQCYMQLAARPFFRAQLRSIFVDNFDIWEGQIRSQTLCAQTTAVTGHRPCSQGESGSLATEALGGRQLRLQRNLLSNSDLFGAWLFRFFLFWKLHGLGKTSLGLLPLPIPDSLGFGFFLSHFHRPCLLRHAGAPASYVAIAQVRFY